MGLSTLNLHGSFVFKRSGVFFPKYQTTLKVAGFTEYDDTVDHFENVDYFVRSILSMANTMWSLLAHDNGAWGWT